MPKKNKNAAKIDVIAEQIKASLVPEFPEQSEKSVPMYEDARTLNIARLHERFLIGLPLGEKVLYSDNGEREIVISNNFGEILSNPDINFFFAVARQEFFKRHGSSKKLISNKPISIPIDELIILRGNKPTKYNRQNMRRRIEKAGDLLNSLSIKTIDNPRDPNGREVGFPRMLQDYRIRNNCLVMHFSDRYAKNLVQTFYLDAPRYMFLIDTRKRNASSMVYKLNHYYRLNLNKEAKKLGKDPSEVKNYRAIIGIPYILEFCPESPTIEEVQKSGRQLKQRIIEPLEKNLAAIAEASEGVFEWEYCDKNKEPLTEEQLSRPITIIELNERFIKYKM